GDSNPCATGSTRATASIPPRSSSKPPLHRVRELGVPWDTGSTLGAASFVLGVALDAIGFEPTVDLAAFTPEMLGRCAHTAPLAFEHADEFFSRGAFSGRRGGARNRL